MKYCAFAYLKLYARYGFCMFSSFLEEAEKKNEEGEEEEENSDDDVDFCVCVMGDDGKMR